MKKVSGIVLLFVVLSITTVTAVLVIQAIPTYPNVVVSGTFGMDVCDRVSSNSIECSSNSTKLIDITFNGPDRSTNFTDGRYSITLSNRQTYEVHVHYLNTFHNNGIGYCQVTPSFVLNVQADTYTWNHFIHLRTDSSSNGYPHSNDRCAD